MCIIENNFLKITIKERGAELRSVLDKSRNEELLWQADPQYWAKSSPILFPIVGALKDDSYIYQGKKFALSRHGFARDRDFTLFAIDKSKLVFELSSDVLTKQIYPFDFNLRITYTLVEKCLKVSYEVFNLSAINAMYFSLGAHPAFRVGNTSAEFSDYSLKFNNDTFLQTTLLENNLLMDVENIIGLNAGNLALNYKMFENDALVVHGLKSNEITLSHSSNGELFKFSFQNFSYFGMWTVPGANFICLEPWAGIADYYSHNQQLKGKAGINTLNPLASWKANWSIRIL